ncbi:ABC-2 family transporter protein [compost metagenome]
MLGWGFLGLAYVLSSVSAEKSTAAGLALGVWFFFVLVFDLALLALLVLSEGQFNPKVLPWLLLLNPADVYRLINLSGFDGGATTAGVLSLGSDLPLPGAMLWLCLLLWVAAPLGSAWLLFRRRAT